MRAEIRPNLSYGSHLHAESPPCRRVAHISLGLGNVGVRGIDCQRATAGKQDVQLPQSHNGQTKAITDHTPKVVTHTINYHPGPSLVP